MKKIFSTCLILGLLLINAPIVHGFYNPAYLPELYKVLVEARHLKDVPYSKFLRLAKTAEPSVLLAWCRAAPKGQFSRAIVAVGVEKNLIKPTQSLAIEKNLRGFEGYFTALQQKGVPYAKGKVDAYYQKLAEDIAANKKIDPRQVAEETRQMINGGLSGTRHAVSGVPYNQHGFPIFDAVCETRLPAELIKAKDVEQFRYATLELARKMRSDPRLAMRFTPEQREQIMAGYKPKGFTWHHHEDTGRMQLVETSLHQATPHRGGKAIWGGGQEYR